MQTIKMPEETKEKQIEKTFKRKRIKTHEGKRYKLVSK